MNRNKHVYVGFKEWKPGLLLWPIRGGNGLATNTGFKGVDVRQTGTSAGLVFRAFLQNSSGGLVVSGTTSLFIMELQSDGTIKTYDFNNNTFSTGTVTTESVSMTYRKSNNAATDTGLWTYDLATVTGFTKGAIYLIRVNNTGASPTDQMREFQYGSDQGDLVVTDSGTAGTGYLQVQLANTITHGGNAALLQLGSSSSTPAFLVQNSAGDAAQFNVTGSNGVGFKLTGHGSGEGLKVTGGAIANGTTFLAASGSGGAGLQALGDGSGPGLNILGGSTGDGMDITGGSSSGHGMVVSVTSGQGLRILSGGSGTGNAPLTLLAGTGTGAPGINSRGDGAGAGIIAVGGSTGAGLDLEGGSSSGSGLEVNTHGDHAIFVQSQGSAKHGLFVTTTTNGDAFHLVGTGTGHGIFASSGSGATGDGIHGVSIATNGDGFSGIGNGTGVGFRSNAAAVGFGSGGGTVDANIVEIGGNAVADDASGHLYVILADGVAHGGTPGSSTATLALLSATVPNGIQANLDGAVNYLNSPVVISDGSFTTAIVPNFIHVIKSVALKPDGKIIVGGQAVSGGTSVFALARYNTDGSLDTSFATSGSNLATPGTYDYINTVAIQSDGKIVSGGLTFTSANNFAIARYNTDGSIDTSFGTSGFNLTTPGTNDLINSIAIQSDGKIVAGGWATVGGTIVFALARYNTDGSLDTSFGTSGFNLTTPGTSDQITFIAIQSDGKIVAGGFATVSGTSVFALARYNTDGSLDTSFATSGFNLTTPGVGDRINSIAIQSDGKIVAGGWATVGGTTVFALARYNTDGSIDTSFATSGFNLVTPGPQDLIDTVALQPDSKIIAGGQSFIGGGGVFALARYNTDGSLDTSFATSGFNLTTPGTNDRINSVVLQSDGKIVAGGKATIGGTGVLALVRYGRDGVLDNPLPYTINLKNIDVSNISGPGFVAWSGNPGSAAVQFTPGSGGYGLDGTLSPATLASLVITDTTKTATDVVSGSVVSLVMAQKVIASGSPVFAVDTAGFRLAVAIAGLGF